MTWEIRYRSAVEHDVAKLPENIRQRAFRILTGLKLDAFPQGCKNSKVQRVATASEFSGITVLCIRSSRPSG